MQKLLFASALFLLLTPASLYAQKSNLEFALSGSKKEMAEIKRVYLNDLRIQQVVQSQQGAMAGNGAAYAKMTVSFGGVDGAAYQAMVREVYEEVKTRLTSLGYQVVTDDDVKGKREKGCATVPPLDASAKLQDNKLVVQPVGQYLCYPASAIAGNFYPNLAKDVGAVVLSFNYVVSTVSYERSGSFAGRRASVEGTPGLGINGTMMVYSPKAGGYGLLRPTGYPGTEWVAPAGLHETSANNKPWMGSSMGKYVLEVDQVAYLAAVKKLVLAAAMESIDAWQAKLK